MKENIIEKLFKNKYFSKILILVFIVLFIIVASIIHKTIGRNTYANKITKIAEENKNVIFSIEKVLIYSSAGIENNNQSNLKDLGICQYTDLAIYINNKNSITDINEKNTVSQLYIDNIKIESQNNSGEKILNYKNFNDFGKFKSFENCDRIDFDVIRTNKENEERDYSKPSFYTDCSNPVTIGYINKNITQYSASQNDNLVYYDGKILKNAKVELEELRYNLSFKIHIINNINEEFIYEANIKDVVSNDDKAIYNNGFVAKMKTKFAGGSSFLKLVK